MAGKLWENPQEALMVFIGTPVFLASWAYFIATYGFMLGVGLGWFPAMVIAGVAVVLVPIGLFLLIPILGLAVIAAGLLALFNLPAIIHWLKAL